VRSPVFAADRNVRSSRAYVSGAGRSRRPPASRRRPRLRSCRQLATELPRISAISSYGSWNASRSTNTARSGGDIRSIRCTVAYATLSRSSAVSIGPSAPVATGSGSHGPT
jgi:hypothetical protein